MLSEKEIYELQAQLEFYKNHAKKAEKKALENEEKYKSTKQKLTGEIEKLNDEKQKLNAEIKQIAQDYNWVLAQLKLSKKKIFGKSAEKIAEDYGQISFFNEAEIERKVLQPEPKIEEIIVPSHKRKKKRSFDEKYGNLPVDEVVYELSDEEKTCEKCGSEMTFLKYETRRELKIVPAKVSVVEHKKAVYVCKNCDKNGVEGNFKSAKGMPALIEKSLVSPSILAYVMNQKFCNAMPLYRQEQEFKRMGIKLNRSTLANWMITGSKVLKPIYEHMHEKLVTKDVLHADETTLEVLNHPDFDKPLNAYMWVYRTSRVEKNPIVLYKYEIGRSGDYADKFLDKFSGYLHCDGWSGYSKVKNAKRCGCWAHLRRYFFDAFEIQEDKSDFSTPAGQALRIIGKIFAVEKLDPKKPSEKSTLSLDEISKIRSEKSAVLVDEFFKFCENQSYNCLPKSLLGKAICYAINQKGTLKTFLNDPRIELTNNAAERVIKPFVIGRKNWLFCNTPGGAESSAVIYSLIETAKANRVEPYSYLVSVFEKLQSGVAPADLVPWGVELP